MFFYRPWAGNEDKYPSSPVSTPDIFASQFANYRWGYAALLLLTLVGGVLLNGSVLGAFMFNWKNLKKMPHTVIFAFCIRDLLVALVLIPICVDWYIVHVGAFSGGYVLCAFTSFLDFTLALQYALLLIVMAIVLYTRKFPKITDTLDELPMDEMINHQYSPPASLQYPGQRRTPSRQDPHRQSPSRNGSRAGSRQGSRAPSVAGSVDGYGRRQMPNRGYSPSQSQQFVPKRPGSVTGSIEGRLATSTPSGFPRGNPRFKASSPLREETEEDLDLWDVASLEYPGRQSPKIVDWDEVEDMEYYDEPKYHHWHLYVLILSVLMAIGIGVPAAMFAEHREAAPRGPAPNAGYPNAEYPNAGYANDIYNGRSLPSRPGCFIPADPFKNPYSATVNDPGFNFTMSFVIIEFMITFVLMILLLCLICYKETKSLKFRRFLKILIGCFVTFMISRSPIDILQFKGLIEAAMGFKQLNILAYELEYEILLIWTTYLPLIFHPILFLSFVSEYREGARRTWRTICGCQQKYEAKQQAKLDNYKSDEIMSERSAISKTQTSNIL